MSMKKRFLSIVLAVLMLVGIMPISAIAADAEPPAAQTGVSTKTSENTTGPKLEKSAQWVDEKAGIAKITIQVTGEQPTETTKKTDIVLVIDRSLSMTQNDREWLKNAKKAAKAFAKKVLTRRSECAHRGCCLRSEDHQRLGLQQQAGNS